MCADADGLYIVADGLRGREAHAPIGHIYLMLPSLYGVGYIFAAGEHRRRNAAGIGKKRLCPVHGQKSAAVHDGYFPAHVIRLVTVMRDHDHLTPEAREYVAHFYHKLIPEMRIERGKGLVQQQKLRVADHDARKRRALSLTAGELRGTVIFKSSKLEHIQHFFELFLFFALVPDAAHTAEYVLAHRHIRKQRIVLEQITHAALLRREIYPLCAVI